jgi:hypothetical protein
MVFLRLEVTENMKRVGARYKGQALKQLRGQNHDKNVLTQKNHFFVHNEIYQHTSLPVATLLSIFS